MHEALLTTRETNKMELSAVISRLSKIYSAFCPELKLAGIGENAEEALRNLEKTIQQYSSGKNLDKTHRPKAPIATITKVFITN